MHLKQCALRDIKREGDRSFGVTLYDANTLDRDGETLDTSGVTVSEPLTLQIDHDRSVLKTVGQVTGIRWVGRRLRGVLTFAPEGVSEVADQVYRQVAAGITTTTSIGFRAQPTQAPEGHIVWRNVELYELSFVSVPSSPGALVDQRAMAKWIAQMAAEGVQRDLARRAVEDDEPVLEVDDSDALIEFDDRDFKPALRAAMAEAFARTRSQRMNAAHLSGLLGERDVFDVDIGALRVALSSVVRSTLREIVNDATTRELNRIRGRVD